MFCQANLVVVHMVFKYEPTVRHKRLIRQSQRATSFFNSMCTTAFWLSHNLYIFIYTTLQIRIK